MPRMSVISMLASGPSICRRLMDFLSSTRFIGVPFHHVVSRLFSLGGGT
jgi:hypothetical protein